MNPQEFVNKWRGVTLKERSASQSHFNDLCALANQRDPIEDDPTGEQTNLCEKQIRARQARKRLAMKNEDDSDRRRRDSR